MERPQTAAKSSAPDRFTPPPAVALPAAVFHGVEVGEHGYRGGYDREGEARAPWKIQRDEKHRHRIEDEPAELPGRDDIDDRNGHQSENRLRHLPGFGLLSEAVDDVHGAAESNGKSGRSIPRAAPSVEAEFAVHRCVRSWFNRTIAGQTVTGNPTVRMQRGNAN